MVSTAKVTSPDILVKQPGEDRTYTFDFANFPEIADNAETVGDAPTPTVVDEAAVLGISGVARVLNTVTARISGGVDSTDYRLVCTVTTSGSNILILDGIMKVRDSDV